MRRDGCGASVRFRNRVKFGLVLGSGLGLGLDLSLVLGVRAHFNSHAAAVFPLPALYRYPILETN